MLRMTMQQSSPSHSDHPIWVEQLIAEAEAIQRMVGKIHGGRWVSDLCDALDLAVRELRQGRPQGVALVTLVGGTGVGKSTLFNALIGKINASPVSHDRRCFTDRPYVAVHPADRPLLDFPEEWQPVYVDIPFRGWAICDAPDINGILESNRQLAKQLIEKSHFLIYVTMSERRADFDVLKEIRNYAIAKRWLFVLNKADEITDLSAVREDFCRRLTEIGFAPDEDVVFVTSARAPENSEVVRLRHFLVERDPREVARLGALDAFLGRLQDALSHERLRPLREAVDRLSKFQEKLTRETREVYREGLQDPVAAMAIQRVMNEAIWQYVVDKSWGFAALIAWLRWRWSRFRLAYALLRLSTSRFSLFQLLHTLVTTSAVVFTNLLPIWQITQHLASHCKGKLEHIRLGVNGLLKELGLLEWSEECSRDSSQQAGALGTEPAILPRWLASLSRVWDVDDPFGSVAALRAEVERTAVDEAQKAVGSAWVQFMVNLLPFAVSIDFAGRMVYFWWQSAPYLSAEPVFPSSHFYLLTAVMLAMTLLPGAILMGRRVRHSSKSLNCNRIVEQVKDFPVLEPLAAAEKFCRQVLERCESLRDTAASFRQSLQLGFATVRPNFHGVAFTNVERSLESDVSIMEEPANGQPQPAEVGNQ
jgi:energy-coupling factor transporter ATP-binding protein EcfA2